MVGGVGNGGNLTPLNRYRKPMHNPIILDLLKYWEKLRAGRIAPLRSEIDPREIETSLDHTFILEQVREDDVRFRLAGSKICELLGMEVRGMPPRSLIRIEDRTEFDETLKSLLRDPQVIELNVACANGQYQDSSGTMLLLPMKNEVNEITRVLGAVALNGPVTIPPNRLSILDRKSTRIVSGAATDTNPPVPGFAERQAPYTAQQAPVPSPNNPFQAVEGNPKIKRKSPTDRGHLRVVDDE